MNIKQLKSAVVRLFLDQMPESLGGHMDCLPEEILRGGRSDVNPFVGDID